MFLCDATRKKNGKEHRNYSLVENRRVASGRVVQRHALYLGEVNDSQEEAWRKTIEIFQEGQARPRTVALFPEDRLGAVADGLHVTLRRRVRDLAPGLTPRSVLEKFATIQMPDVHLPTTGQRTVILSRYTYPETDDTAWEQTRPLALYPADRAVPEHAGEYGVRLGELVLRRSRQWGACWVGCQLWDQLQLEEFWRQRRPDSREGTAGVMCSKR